MFPLFIDFAPVFNIVAMCLVEFHAFSGLEPTYICSVV